MKEWKSLLKEDATDWLLEESNPSVRYFALTELLDTSEDDAKVKKAKGDIMRIAAVPDILARQKTEGYWEDPRSFYTRARQVQWNSMATPSFSGTGSR